MGVAHTGETTPPPRLRASGGVVVSGGSTFAMSFCLVFVDHLPAELDETRVCGHCREDLPLSDFQPSQIRSGGWCRSCCNEARRPRRVLGYVAPKRYCGFCGKDISHRRSQAKWCDDRCAAKGFRQANPDYQRNAWLKTTYGITSEEFDELLESQGGVCVVCAGEPNSEDVWDVDHNHETGAVRGILCPPCNKGLGFLRDDVEVIRRALKYLEGTESNRQHFVRHS